MKSNHKLKGENIMGKSIIEVIKANKNVIIKRGLIIVGAIVGLVVVSRLVRTSDDEEFEIEFKADETEEETGSDN